MSGPTKGPWFADTSGSPCYIRSEPAPHRPSRIIAKLFEIAQQGKYEDDEVAHNACLIAAAPEMLERLETHKDAACLGRNNMFNAPGCGCGPCLDRAAIAKAKEGT